MLTLVDQLPLAWTVAVPAAIVPSNTVTVVPAVPPSASVTVPVTDWAAWLTEPPALVIATTGVVVSICKMPAGLSLVAPDRSALLRSEEHTSELQSHFNVVCRLLLD